MSMARPTGPGVTHVRDADLSGRSDEDLLGRYRAGELRAMSEILSRYRRPLFTFVLRMCPDRARAEDLMQETFLRLVAHEDTFQGQARLKTWMYKIARNLCLDERRRQKHRRHASMDESRDGSPNLHERVPAKALGAFDATSSAELGKNITRAIEALPDEQREVFVLRQVELLSFREIAEVVGVPENTAKSRMRYAMERLQAALSEHYERAEEQQ
jgi:RNA polymerase sigma-70 factor (ECF subfamily)